ncbi:glycosyltransferase family 2 protein [Agromyces albus]|uniref:glycosyltransferase family 2 protein n=1 Tax=Agromyces albus TaxID=205332 RepID=UPI002785E21A|nr:glycosyltransferase family 2 protein [Agromyces albus]MDQ0574686.1 N-acetylglucosaminyl-diphospho-decaprenol L-rhamnosyltransferase [Agromyces albus]
MSPSPALAVVTVSYRSGSVLPGLISSLREATSRPYEVVIADNAPDDGEKRVAVESGARYLPMDRNAGYGGAVNAAIRVLAPEIQWVLICNPDVRLLPGSLDVLVDRLEADPTIGAVGPRVLNEDGSTYPSARAVPSLRTGIGHALFANIWKGNPWTRTYRTPSDLSGEARIAGWLSGSCLLVRRAAFDAIGGFDEGYFMYFEDVDLGVRMAEAGHLNLYEPSARVVHTGAHSTSAEAPRMVAAHHASARRFVGRRYAGPLLLPIRWAIYGALGVRSLTLQLQARARKPDSGRTSA